MERIAKTIASAGICSSRDAEKLIAQGKVAVDGKIITSPALNVSDTARITVEGKLLPQKEMARLWLYHKPAGLITTKRDPEGRKTVFDALPKHMPRVISIGRLDLNSEGLLLLTNDGELARHIELPANGWLRRYRVRVLGSPDPQQLQALKNGLTVEGLNYGAMEVTLENTKATGRNKWLSVGLREGKNREIRRVMEYLGLRVNRLIRVAYGPFALDDLPLGQVREVPQKTVASLQTG
jgi:23S rRNA pseudouridine2605 synthase